MKLDENKGLLLSGEEVDEIIYLLTSNIDKNSVDQHKVLENLVEMRQKMQRQKVYVHLYMNNSQARQKFHEAVEDIKEFGGMFSQEYIINSSCLTYSYESLDKSILNIHKFMSIDSNFDGLPVDELEICTGWIRNSKQKQRLKDVIIQLTELMN